MKKMIPIVLSLTLALALAACGGSKAENTDSAGTESAADTESVVSTESDADAEGEANADSTDGFEWTRTGYFLDENDDQNMLMVYPSEDEAYAGMWGVTLFLGEDMHGWMIDQEGETLHGDLTAEGEGDPFIVTLTEEGETGILLETEAGDQYHFTVMELPEVLATMQINTEGLGEIAYAPEGEEPVFEEGYPYQSAVVNILEGETNIYTIAAKASEGYSFVKWTKNGEDYAEDEQIAVEVTEDVEYIAVFEAN